MAPRRHSTPGSQSARPMVRLSQTDIAAMADRVMAGQPVTPDDIPTFCEVLAELKRRGYRLAQRTEIEAYMQPWVFKVTSQPVPTIRVSGSDQ